MTAARLLLPFLLAAIAAVAAACFSPAQRAAAAARKASSVVSLASGTVLEQKGTVDVPAHVETKAAAVSFVIPKDSVFSFDADLQKMALTFSRDVSATANATEEHATAAKPAGPPSLLEQAHAATMQKFYWIALGLFLLAGFLFYEEHFRAAKVAAAGAIAVPLVAKYLSSDAAQYVTLAAVCISGALFIAWHLSKGKLPRTIVDAVQKTETAVHSVT